MSAMLMHCSYHKCLTIYFSRVIRRVLRARGSADGYRHFNSLIDEFYREQGNYLIASVNNHALDLSRYPRYRVTRFIRDPRDLVVSGYFYHKRGAESWCNVPGPGEADFVYVNGTVPEALRGSSLSYSELLHNLDIEEGLLAEIEFRRRHFESMREWPLDDPDIRLFRYEDVLGREARTMREVIGFLGFPAHSAVHGGLIAWRHSARSRRQSASAHVRDPSAGQWRRHFTPRVEREFDAAYGDLIEMYGYA